jgi:hypothetical protein
VLPFLLDQMLVCSLLGAIVAGVISILVIEDRNTLLMFFMVLIIEDRNNLLMFFMVLFGATAGWLTGMAFIFLTGGLDLSLPWMILPAIIVALSSILILCKLTGRRVMFNQPRWKVGRSLAVVMSVAVILSLVVSLAVLAFPSYGVSYNTESFSVRGTMLTGYTSLTSSSVRALTTELSPSFVSIDSAKSCVHFPVISDNPDEGDYLEFRATFNVGPNGGSWDQPYVKLGVIKDNNGDGAVDAGDEVWNGALYKLATQTSKQWRSNCLWEGTSPVVQLHLVSVSGEILFMPIFHASAITQWKNDQGQTFANTPENYLPPIDQLSWELSGSSVSLKEDITTFAVVGAGSSTNIEGKIYCPSGSAGSHLVLIQAFDLRYTNPFDPAEAPLAQEIMTFSVTSGSGDLYCGDGICSPEIGETHENCPADCPAGTYTLTVNTVPTGCTVAVSGETTQNSGSTGQCVFPGLASGSVKTVTTSKTGYVTDTRQVTMDTDKTLDITLTSGSTPPIIDINYTSWVTAAGLVGLTTLGTVAVWIKGPKFLIKP